MKNAHYTLDLRVLLTGVHKKYLATMYFLPVINTDVFIIYSKDSHIVDKLAPYGSRFISDERNRVGNPI